MASKGDSNGWEMTSGDKRCLLMTRDGLTATNFHRSLVLCHLNYHAIILSLQPQCCLFRLFKRDLKGFKRVPLFKTDICSDLYDTMYWSWQSTFLVQETKLIGGGPLHLMNGNMNKLYSPYHSSDFQNISSGEADKLYSKLILHVRLFHKFTEPSSGRKIILGNLRAALQIEYLTYVFMFL